MAVRWQGTLCAYLPWFPAHIVGVVKPMKKFQRLEWRKRRTSTCSRRPCKTRWCHNQEIADDLRIYLETYLTPSSASLPLRRPAPRGGAWGGTCWEQETDRRPRQPGWCEPSPSIWLSMANLKVKQICVMKEIGQFCAIVKLVLINQHVWSEAAFLSRKVCSAPVLTGASP